jgi:hypothetical protein
MPLTSNPNIFTRAYLLGRAVLKDAAIAYWAIAQVMIPVIVAIKVCKELGWIQYLAWPLEPLMELVGLPPQTGLVWAMGIAANHYSALAVYLNLMTEMPALTVAQVTVLASMLLIAHGLVMECAITRKCGVSFWGQVILRLTAAVGFGALLHLIFSRFGLFEQVASVAWSSPTSDGGLLIWVWDQAVNLAAIFAFILCLMIVMRVLKFLRVTDLFNWALGPVLRLMGIDRRASTITVIGLTMGLGYGGGLIIHEARNGRLSQKDVFAACSLMSLSHGLIDDTILMSLIGASWLGMFWGRLGFSIVVVAILTRVMVLVHSRKVPAHE